MCNLYSMTATVDEMRRVFGPFEGDRDNLPPSDNVFPSYKAPVLRRSGSVGLKLEIMTWGFPGPQAAGGKLVTNVRNLASPFLAIGLKESSRRCLVPVTKFCEWTAEPDPVTKHKSKVWFTHTEHPVAGIWRPGDETPFMAFLTCQPNATVGAVHPKAMPVMLDPTDFGRWLDNEHEDACSLAVPYADERLALIT